MKFSEKLSRLTEDQNKAKIARAAFLPENSINEYIKKGYTPRADNALSLARALKVPLEWLIDDEADFPAPKPNEKPPANRIDDDELMLEVCRRQRRELLLFLKALDDAEKSDWQTVRKALEGWSVGLPLPPSAAALGNTIFYLKVGPPRIEEYDPRKVGVAHHQELPGAERPAEDFRFPNPENRFRAVLGMEGFREVEKCIWESQMEAIRLFNEELKKDGVKAPGKATKEVKDNLNASAPKLEDAAAISAELNARIAGFKPPGRPPGSLIITGKGFETPPPPPSMEQIRNRKMKPGKPAQKPKDKDPKRT